MGGCCCCASKSTEPNGSPTFFHYSVSEQLEPLSSDHATVLLTHSAGLLVDTNLDTSIPDTYQSPPAPTPYETYAGTPLTPSRNRERTTNKNDTILQMTEIESVGDVIKSSSALETKVKDVECDEKGNINISKDVEDEKSDELKKSIESMVPPLQDEEDICPTCLEEYDDENPKIIPKCEHHFHLACILEWMERCDTCPVCDQEMIFSPSI